MHSNIMGIPEQQERTKSQVPPLGQSHLLATGTGAGQFVDKITRLLFQNQGTPPLGFGPTSASSSSITSNNGANSAHTGSASGSVSVFGSHGPRTGSHGASMYVNGRNIMTAAPHTNPGINFSFNSSISGSSNSSQHNQGHNQNTTAGIIPSVSYANPVLSSHSQSDSHTHAHKHYSVPPSNIVQHSADMRLNAYSSGNAAGMSMRNGIQSTHPHQKGLLAEMGAPPAVPIQKSTYSNGGPYGGAKRGAGTRKRKRQAPTTGGGARAVRVPADRDFAVGLDDPLCECLRQGGRELNSLELQKLKDATSLLQEMQLHILEPLTLYTPAELYELMASIAETWKNSGKAAWKKRINKIKENARGRKPPRNQLDPAEINEINQLNERIRIRENWEKNEKEKIDLEKRLEKRSKQRTTHDKKAKGGKNNAKKQKNLADTAAKNEKNEQKSNKPIKAKASAAKKGNKNAKEEESGSDTFVPGVADIASVLAMGKRNKS